MTSKIPDDKRLFPLANDKQKKHGWLLDPQFLKKVLNCDLLDGSIIMEDVLDRFHAQEIVEEILLAAEEVLSAQGTADENNVHPSDIGEFDYS